MNRQWQLQEAKNRLSEVLDRANSEGPQTVTRRGVPAAVILSVRDYKKLTRPESSLLEFFQNSPVKGIDLDLARRREFPREVDL